MAACTTRVGVSSAATASPGTPANRRAKVDWLPPPHVSPLTPDGRWSPVWYRFFREIAENRMGGIQGQTIPQVSTAASSASAKAATVGVFANQVLTYAEEINTTVAATVQVSVDNGLTGAGDIPPGPTTSPSQYEP